MLKPIRHSRAWHLECFMLCFQLGFDVLSACLCASANSSLLPCLLQAPVLGVAIPQPAVHPSPHHSIAPASAWTPSTCLAAGAFCATRGESEHERCCSPAPVSGHIIQRSENGRYCKRNQVGGDELKRSIIKTAAAAG